MTTLYGGITAKIYGHDGKIITTIFSEDETQGILTVLYEKLVDKLYKKISPSLRLELECINISYASSIFVTIKH